MIFMGDHSESSPREGRAGKSCPNFPLPQREFTLSLQLSFPASPKFPFPPSGQVTKCLEAPFFAIRAEGAFFSSWPLIIEVRDGSLRGAMLRPR